MYNYELNMGSCFVNVLLFKVLRGVFFLIVIKILLHTNIIKGVASAKYFLCFFVLSILLAACSAVSCMFSRLLVCFGIYQAL